MKVVVDFAACEMHGDCVMEAPEVFDLEDDSEWVTVLQEHIGDDLRPKVELAARMCPVAAIRLEED